MVNFCTKCGNAVPINSLFCPKCGTKLPIILDNTQTTDTPSAVPQKIQPSYYIPPVSKSPTTSQQGRTKLDQDPFSENTPKKRTTNEWIAICCGGIILLVVVSAIISGISGSKTTSPTTPIQQATLQPTPTINPIVQIKNYAQTIPYDDLFRNNENYVGKTVYYRGKIIQIMPVFGDNYIIRVATKKSQYLGYIEDILYVDYKGTRYLEGDTIDLWAKVDGLETYSAVLGNPVTIPKVTALHTELIQKASGTSSDGSVTTSQNPSASSTPLTYQIGETASDGNLKVTVNSKRFADKITMTSSTSYNGQIYTSNMDFKPSQGKQFLILDVTVENAQPDDSQTVSTLLQFHVIDADGYQYPYNMYSVYLDKKFGGGNLAPGQKMRGDVAFEVPLNPNGLKFEFKYDLGGDMALFTI